MAIVNIAISPRTSLVYMTVGALIDVWTIIWYFALGVREGMDNRQWFWLLGFFFSGLTLMIIGMFLRPGKHTVVSQPEMPVVAAPPATMPAVPVSTRNLDEKTVPAPDATITGAQIPAPTPEGPSQPLPAQPSPPPAVSASRPGFGR